LILVTMLLYYIAMIHGTIIACPILGILLAIDGLAIQHDANHGAFSKHKYLNIAACFVNDLIGGSSLVWRHQHVVAHHAYPNNEKLDGDTYSNYPLLRLNPNLPILWYSRFQCYYAPLLYSFLGMAYFFGDFQSIAQGKYLHVDFQPVQTKELAIFYIGKLIHFTLFMLLPVHLHGPGGLLLYLSMQLVGGNFLASVFAVSHNLPNLEYNMDENTDWAEIQIKTAANWGVDSIFWWLVSGGLNYQIEHHLFPGVCHEYYPAISKIVSQVCKERKLPYNAYPTFSAIYADHLKALAILGASDPFKG